MRIIKPAISIISKILGEQKRKPGIDYRLTNHSFIVPCGDCTLLFHTLTQVLFLLEKNEKPEDFMEVFIKEWFYVPVDFDENKLANDLIVLSEKLQKTSSIKTSFTVFTTTDCNARCYYCYEKGRKRIFMSDQTACDVADYIVKKSHGSDVDLAWFGGEPLCNKRAIDVITERLKKNNVSFHSQMISNGYYLDQKICEEAIEKWNLKRVQITLDGTKEFYLNAKKYVNSDPNAYEKVLENIEFALKNGISVSVRLNLDGSNADDLFELVKELKNRFENYDRFHVYVALLRPLAGEIHSFDDDLKELEVYEKLCELIYSYGIGNIFPLDMGIRLNRCMADNDACEVILPDGRIGKCEHYSESNLIGSIYSDEYDEGMINKWKEVMPKYPECDRCPLYPRCIQLRMCDYTEQNCRKAERMRREYVLSKQILNEFEQYKKKEEKQ